MATRYHDLYPQITDFANLWLAWRKAARGKRGRRAAAGFEFELEDRLIELQGALRARTYRPGGYDSFYIRDPKRRLISAAPFRDRVVHHALCNILEPIFERTFIADSYANRKGKGSHAALNRAQQFSRRFRYVLQCDIRKFFPSIDHAMLAQQLERKIADESTMWLIRCILESGEGVLDEQYEMVRFPGDDLFAACRPRGLPIGNLTSQFWANVHLNELDQFVKRRLRCPGYVRYVDDFLLFSHCKDELWHWKDAVRAFLSGLRLTLHERSSTVYPASHGIPFLGFRIFPEKRRLKRRNGVNFARRLKRDHRAYARGELDLADLMRRLRGWIAHAKHGDTWNLRRSLLARPLPPRQTADCPKSRRERIAPVLSDL